MLLCRGAGADRVENIAGALRMQAVSRLLVVGICLIGAYVSWETAGSYEEANMPRRERHYRSISATLVLVSLYYAYKGLTRHRS